MRAKSRKITFAVCLATEADEDLQVGKIYRVVPDARAAEVDCMRVIDDSGEGYLYSAKRFVLVNVSEKGRSRLLKVV